jgi:outer membrane protein assembly factor BamD
MDNMMDGYHVKAAQTFEEVERQYPYSSWAKKAQIMAGFCYYKGSKPEQAVAVLNTFASLHPGHELTPYATYLIGLIHYGRVRDPKRDHKITQEAFDALEQHVKRFPTSIYHKDAQERIVLLKSLLAAKEIEVARTYQKEGANVAALGRYQTVLNKHGDSIYSPEAYYRLVEVFLDFGDIDRANEMATLIAKRHPDSKWTKMSQDLVKSSPEK